VPNPMGPRQTTTTAQAGCRAREPVAEVRRCAKRTELRAPWASSICNGQFDNRLGFGAAAPGRGGEKLNGSARRFLVARKSAADRLSGRERPGGGEIRQTRRFAQFVRGNAAPLP